MQHLRPAQRPAIHYVRFNPHIWLLWYCLLCTSVVAMAGCDRGRATALAVEASMVSSLGHVDDAIVLYSKAIKLWPENADLYCDRAGQYRIRSADRQKALADYQEAIRLAPQSDRPHLGLGYLYSSERNFAAAVSAFSKAAELSPEAQTFRARGIAYRELGDYDLAIGDFSRPIELKPDDRRSYYQRGRCYKAKGEPAKAAQDDRRSRWPNHQALSHSHSQN